MLVYDIWKQWFDSIIFVDREIWNFIDKNYWLKRVFDDFWLSFCASEYVRHVNPVFGKYYFDVARIEHPSKFFARFYHTKADSRVTIFESTLPEQRDEKSGTRRFNVPFNKRITKSNREFVWRVWSKIRLLRLISC